MLSIIGMSPGNSYFKDREIAYLLREAIKRYGKTVVMVADVPAEATYFAMGYNLSKSKEKARLQGNGLKNKTRRVIADIGIDENNVIIVDRAREVETNLLYKEKYDDLQNLYNSNQDFRNMANKTSEEVLKNSGKDFTDTSIKHATHYLLSEIAFLEFAPKFFGEEKISYLYHKNRPIFEYYIIGKFDGKIRNYLDYVLLESPDETYYSYLGEEKNRLEVIQKRGTIKCGFVPYFNDFKIESDGTYSGKFYDIIKSVAEKNNLQLEFVEQVGYGTISQRLNGGFFDVFCCPISATKSRKLEMFFSKKIIEGDMFAYINTKSIYSSQDLETLRENSNLTIAIKENDIHHDVVEKYFPKARLVRVPQLSGIEEVLKFVIDGRVDMTFRHPNLVERYLQENNLPKDIVLKKGFGENPIISYDIGISFPRGEFELKRMIDEDIKN